MTLTQRILGIGLIIGLITNILSLDPKFDPSTRMKLVLIPADAAIGSVIYRLRATDEEFDYPLQFELIGDTASSIVQINSLPCTKYNSLCQANVILQRRLEPGRYYDFQVSVKDTKGGMAVQLCSITATNFTTRHDSIFPHKPGIIIVPEDAKRGKELDYVISRNNPLFMKPVYLELWGSALFAIRQKIVTPEMTEGTIFLLGPLDFEKQAMYHLTVLANDAYAEPGQDTRNIAGLEVVVIVQDVQDVPPLFTMAPPVTKLPSGLLPGDKVLEVHAEDGDKGNPREIRYGLVSEGNPFTSYFEINDTSGEIYLLRPIDEIAAITHIGDPVLLTVIAEEVKVARDEPPAMSATVQLAFFLPERSNSPPYFDNDHYTTSINENVSQGTALVFNDPYSPRVNDDDTGKNGVFSLTLLNNNGTFEISPNVAERSASFVIKVRDNQYLDYEERHSVEFKILAQELGPSTNLSAIVNVTVYLMDINDNPPVFTESIYTVELPENMTLGTKVVQVHADDIDTGTGANIRYTQILGYLNTSVNLNPVTGIITISTDNHGFDREIMPEYHLYIEARDNDGTGNRAQVPLIIKIIDVNDEAPIFEKTVYEFILSNELTNFTSPAFIKAIDKDATSLNNEVRYEILNGNYENKFQLNKITGELTIKERIIFNNQRTGKKKRQTSNDINNDVFVLMARAYDLGVPVMFSTTTIRVYPPESRSRTVKFVVPGYNLDRKKTEDTLSAITGGNVVIHDIRPFNANEPGAKIIGDNTKERSVVTATVLYNGNGVVDVSHIQQRLAQHNNSFAIMPLDNQSEKFYKAENKLMFWLLILLALLIAATILTVLFCCICSWCPLYGTASKRVINVSNTEDDVHLVHREMANGKETKSVQVAEWMGRKEAWSAEKPTDARTRPTRWEFSRHLKFNEGVEHADRSIENVYEKRGARSADDRKIRNKNNSKNLQAAKESQFYNSRTNLINDHDVYIEDRNDHIYETSIKHIDDDSIRRHEIDRGSDIDYARSSLRQNNEPENGKELYIKDGNAEILQLLTQSKHEDENFYVNVPVKTKNISQPQFIMVENSGKDILLRRFIEEQSDGKQFIREHYQMMPDTKEIKTIPSEIQSEKIIYDSFINKPESDIKIIHTMANQTTNQTFHELETSLMQQNSLLRQILLEREKLDRFNQPEITLETQSLPCHTSAIATQTDCDAGTQTDFNPVKYSVRRNARSENDDSLSEDEYEFVNMCQSESPEGIYWIKRKRQKKKIQRYTNKPSHRRIVMVEEIKKKIRTPIKEECDEISENRKSPATTRVSNKKPGILRKTKEGNTKVKQELIKSSLSKDVLLEISDSLDEPSTLDTNIKRKNRVNLQKIDDYVDSDEMSDENEIVIRRNTYTSECLHSETEKAKRLSNEDSAFGTYEYVDVVKRSGHRSTKTSPKRKIHISRIDNQSEIERYRQRQAESESPNRSFKKMPEKCHDQNKNKKSLQDKSHSEHNLGEIEDKNKAPTRYMEWYYDMKNSGDGKRIDDIRLEKCKSKGGTKKLVGASEKRITKSRNNKIEDRPQDTKYKPEPMPRKTPTKVGKSLKEISSNERKAKIQPDKETSHPLLQHSEHHYEHNYTPDIPTIQPSMLPHYMYPETPPYINRDNKIMKKNLKTKPSPIKENEVKITTSRTSVYINPQQQTPTHTTLLNPSALEDDHDSGIAMNSLLHNMGKRNPITEKKSVFTIAYDDVSQVKKIRTESDSPQPT